MLAYLEILFRQKARFIVLLIVLPMVIVVGTIALYPTYRGGAQLWVDNYADVGLGSPSGWSIYLSPSQNMADDFNQFLQTKSFKDRLYNNMINSGFVSPAQRDDLSVSIYDLSVSAPASHLLVVSTTCDLRQICLAVVNTAIGEFRDQEIKLEHEQAQVAIRFFNERLQTAVPARDAAQAKFDQYLAENSNLRTDLVAQAYDNKYQQLSSDLRDKKAAVADLQAKVERANYINSATSQTLYGPQVVDPPRITKGGVLGDGSSLRRAVFGLIGCYAVAGMYVFLLTWIDKTAREPRDLERRLKVPVVATIPRLDKAA